MIRSAFLIVLGVMILGCASPTPEPSPETPPASPQWEVAAQLYGYEPVEEPTPWVEDSIHQLKVTGPIQFYPRSKVDEGVGIYFEVTQTPQPEWWAGACARMFKTLSASPTETPEWRAALLLMDSPKGRVVVGDRWSTIRIEVGSFFDSVEDKGIRLDFEERSIHIDAFPSATADLWRIFTYTNYPKADAVPHGWRDLPEEPNVPRVYLMTSGSFTKTECAIIFVQPSVFTDEPEIDRTRFSGVTFTVTVQEKTQARPEVEWNE